MPLVMLLHGCNQSAEEFVATTRFTALADRHGFVIVAPRQTRGNQPGRCWRWFDMGHQFRGAGEPAVLAGIVAELLADPRLRVLAGLPRLGPLDVGEPTKAVLVGTPAQFRAVRVHIVEPGDRS